MRRLSAMVALCFIGPACDNGSGTCEQITVGSGWAWSGPCLGMTMACEIAGDGCDFTITCTGMEMGLPEMASVAGDTITFDDGSEIRGCQGTVTDADTLSGTCEGGCAWTLERS